MKERLASRHVVLMGIGHTNAHVLRMWRMNALPDTDLTCLSNFGVATYSGMLPAVLAGQKRPVEMEIDLVRLCAVAGARLITDRVTGINHDDRTVEFADRPAVPFDVLSIGIGSTATLDGVTVTGNHLVEIKPMQTFLDRLARALDSAATRVAEVAKPPARQGPFARSTTAKTIESPPNTGDPLKICVVGGGVAGTEICACLPPFLSRYTDQPWTLCLVTGGDTILPELRGSTRQRVEDELRGRGVSIVTGAAVTHVGNQSIQLQGGSAIDADVVLWATGAAPPSLVEQLELDRDQRGFLATDAKLQSTSARGILVVGDTGTIVDSDVPKAGVYAVRQGPLLWENIQRYLDDQPLQTYQPQQSFLKLINLGDGRAVGQWKTLTFSGRWVMRLKDWIDSRFMEKYSVDAMDDSSMSGDEPMQCRGCGCKLDAAALLGGLSSTDQGEFEDAARIGGNDTRMIASTDFFSSPVDDAYLAGRIAAIHSASDILASGGLPTEALANVVLPAGSAKDQQRMLQDFLAGARREFDTSGARIVGGHTIVGPRLEVGFTVIGRPVGRELIRKSNLQVGDRLVLTKPLGIGVLLAAQMRGACPAGAYEALIETMLTSQHALTTTAVQAGVTAGTDVTGFGLAGHLIEMLTASGVAAELWLDRIPLLPSAAELVSGGIESSLTPGNRTVERQISIADPLRANAEYQLLFDPQTCGGLLLGVCSDRYEELRHKIGASEFTALGRVISEDHAEGRLRIRTS